MSRALRFAGPSVLLLSAVMLTLCWDRIPSHWAVHWGKHGVVNGWAKRSPAAVFGPLVLGFLVWLLLEVLATVIERVSAQKQLARINAVAVRAIGTAVTALFAALAVLLPLVEPQKIRGIVFATVVWTFGVALASVFYVGRKAYKLREEGQLELPKGWTGAVYNNPEDRRLFVPKLIGIGWTLNFGNPRSWFVLVLLLLPSIAAVYLGLKLVQ